MTKINKRKKVSDLIFKILIVMILVFLVTRLVTLKVTVEALKIYLKKIDRYPQSEDVDICTKEYLSKLLKQS